MDDTNAHPSDEMLFDLVEGLLDPAEAARVEEHLDRCSACAAFTTASLNGSVADVGMSLVETMPEAAAERMHVVLTQAWRTRTAAIAAEEAAQDAASTPAPATVPASDAIATTELAAPAVEPLVPRPDRRKVWTRRVVPILAFAVLATLAGASILIDDQPTSSNKGGATADSVNKSSTGSDESAGTSSGSDGASTEPDYSDTQPDPDDFDGSNGITPPSTGEAPAAAPGAADTGTSLEDAAREAGSGDAASGSSGDDDAQSVPPTSGATGSAAEIAPSEGTTTPSDTEAAETPEEIPTIEPVCIATLDNTRLYLPDGRIPNQIVRGPLGVYVVCG